MLHQNTATGAYERITKDACQTQKFKHFWLDHPKEFALVINHTNIDLFKKTSIKQIKGKVYGIDFII